MKRTVRRPVAVALAASPVAVPWQLLGALAALAVAVALVAR